MQLSGSEASNGLVLPAVAITYFGQTGAVLVVIICFMAVTSSGAGEGLACTSLFTYDVYRRYIKPKVGSSSSSSAASSSFCLNPVSSSSSPPVSSASSFSSSCSSPLNLVFFLPVFLLLPVVLLSLFLTYGPTCYL